MLVLKGKDSGIMVSDFICEKTGYLMMKNMKLPKLNTLRKRVLDLTQDMVRAKKAIGTHRSFCKLKGVAEFKYPKEKGYRIAWVFDHSSCHGTYNDNALVAYKINAKRGGKQPCSNERYQMKSKNDMIQVLTDKCFLTMDFSLTQTEQGNIRYVDPKFL